MTSIRRRGHAAAALAVAVLGASPAAALDCSAETLARFHGTWDVRGAAQPSPDAAREAIRCRIQFSEASGQLATAGRCATANEQRSVSGGLACSGDSFAGPFLVLEGVAPPVFVNDISGSEDIQLVLQADDPDTGEPGRYRMILRFDGDGFDLSYSKGPWTALDLDFSPSAG